MTIVVFPVDAVTGAPNYSGRMLRQAHSVFMAGATPARPFAVTSGVRPGTSTTTVTATSTTWTMGLHAGILDLETAVEASAYAYSVNTAQTGAVTAAHATLPRVDIVWVRLDDPAEADGSSVPAVVAGYTAGTAAASPVAPATPARCMVLAQLNVPASGGGAPTVAWKAPYAVAASPLDTGWVVPALQNSWANYEAVPSLQRAAAYRVVGTDVYLRGFVRNGAPNVPIFTLPVGARPTYSDRFLCEAGSSVGGTAGGASVSVQPSGAVQVELYTTSSNNTFLSLAGIRVSLL